MPSPVDALKRDLDEVVGQMLPTNPSLVVAVTATLSKALVVAGASELESEVQEHLLDFVAETANGNARVGEFMKNKAISRQFHTYFNWNGNNANSFFALFGQEFREHASAVVESDPILASSVRSFLELGDLRNRLVHQNFVAYSLDKTPDEIHSLYVSARTFSERIPALLRSR